MANIMDYKSLYATCPQADTQRWEDRKNYKKTIYNATDELMLGKIDAEQFKACVRLARYMFHQ
jgi:hypothetical protein